MATLQEQARALGDPTRHAVFRYVASSQEPVGVAELTEHFGFNHNAIRQHLAKLLAAGLVDEATSSSGGRGRPRLLYTVSPSAAGQWGTTGPYERLSRLLLEIIRTGRSPVDVGREAAVDLRVPSPSGDAVADISAAMARQGFEPEVRETREGTEMILHNCPFETAALADRDTVCSLHLGIADGLAAPTEVTVERLVANDPRRAECKLHLRVAEEADEAATDATSRLTIRGKGRR